MRALSFFLSLFALLLLTSNYRDPKPVTPLDVVRVRLQSQHPASLPRTTATAPTAAAARNTPLRAHKLPLSPLRFQSTAALSAPELGVTACCREVFWITNASEACIALSPSSSQTSFTDSCVVEETSRRRFHGTWEGLVKIARYEGITSLWRGLSPTLLMAIPANVIYFTGYDALRGSPWSPFSALGATWAPLLAGSSARAIAATAISPLELFRTRLQATGAHSFRDTAAGVRSMVATEGVASLWRGLGLTLWRDVPFSGVYWFGYEAIRDGLRRRREREWRRDAPLRGSSSSSSRVLAADIHAESTFADSFIAGATSGAVAALLTTPFDVGKTRRQVAIGRGAAVAGESLVGVLSAIWSAEGIAGLMRGAVPRMLKVAPACAIMVGSFFFFALFFLVGWGGRWLTDGRFRVTK